MRPVTYASSRAQGFSFISRVHNTLYPSTPSSILTLRARFFAGCGFEWRAIEVLLGFKALSEVSTSGSTVTLYYGPAFSIEYNFRSRLINEKHKRTTAFKDFDF